MHNYVIKNLKDQKEKIYYKNTEHNKLRFKKGDSKNIVTDKDLEIEKALIRLLKNKYPKIKPDEKNITRRVRRILEETGYSDPNTW